jgi:hypothetical protein
MQKTQPNVGLAQNLVPCLFNWANSKLIFKLMRIVVLHATIAMTLYGMTLANVSSGQGYLDRQVTMKYEEVSLKKALSDIEKQASIKFAYSGSIVKLHDKITLDVKEEKLREVLDELLRPRNISYSEENGYIVLTQNQDNGTTSIKEKPANSKGSDMVLAALTGRVTDASTQEPLPGVNILERWPSAHKPCHGGPGPRVRHRLPSTAPAGNRIAVAARAGCLPRNSG